MKQRRTGPEKPDSTSMRRHERDKTRQDGNDGTKRIGLDKTAKTRQTRQEETTQTRSKHLIESHCITHSTRPQSGTSFSNKRASRSIAKPGFF